MTALHRAFVALGSNLGDRRGHLEAALARLAATDGVRVAAVSPAFENPPVGGPEQGDYWNAVAEVRTEHAPRALWERLRAIEDAEGRVRAERDGPRTLDLDLLVHGTRVGADDDLVLPHPRALDRAFTLVPWAEIAPDFVVPGTGRTVVEHEAACAARDPAGWRAMRRAALLAVRRRAGKAPAVFRHRAALDAWRRRAEGPVGFLPTLGALHEGHASHVRRARAECETVVASVFVNPLQFGQPEDLARYPKTFEADVALLAAEGCDAVYAPEAPDLYPEGFRTSVDVEGLSSRLEGAARPGHFRGVATVVAKLLARVRPDVTYFGRKDAQQCAVVRTMARDLDLPGTLSVGATVRDVDGLALSSRNRFLSPEERGRALAIPAALAEARLVAAAGERRAEALEALARARLTEGTGTAPDYAAVVDPDSFAPVADLLRPALLVVAVRVGSVRLLDNAWICAPDAG